MPIPALLTRPTRPAPWVRPQQSGGRSQWSRCRQRPSTEESNGRWRLHARARAILDAPTRGEDKEALAGQGGGAAARPIPLEVPVTRTARGEALDMIKS